MAFLFARHLIEVVDRCQDEGSDRGAVDHGPFQEGERLGTELCGHVDGALLFSLRADDPLPGMVELMGLPAVFGGRPVIGSGHGSHGYTYVDADNRGGAREAVRYLVSQGRRHIGTITGPLNQAPRSTVSTATAMCSWTARPS
jgi:DNA-binding LacI/PurR family transcriptional regulator